MYDTCKPLLPRAAKQGVTIDHVIDITLSEVLDLDEFLENGGLNGDDVVGFILLSLKPEKMRLVLSGKRFIVRRFTNEEYAKMLKTSRTSEQSEEISDSYEETSDLSRIDSQHRPSARILNLMSMPTVSIVQGSDCQCTHGGVTVTACLRGT
jgi:hypothetical protein